MTIVYHSTGDARQTVYFKLWYCIPNNLEFICIYTSHRYRNLSVMVLQVSKSFKSSSRGSKMENPRFCSFKRLVICRTKIFPVQVLEKGFSGFQPGKIVDCTQRFDDWPRHHLLAMYLIQLKVWLNDGLNRHISHNYTYITLISLRKTATII